MAGCTVSPFFWCFLGLTTRLGPGRAISMNKTTSAASLLISAVLVGLQTPLQPIQSALGFSIFGYTCVDYLIPKVGAVFIKRGIFGKDMSKVGRPIIPETIGVIPALVYLLVMFFYIPFLFARKGNNGGGGEADASVFSHSKLSSYLSSLLSLESMILLGLMDDLFDIRWRHKFFLPAIASIPLLIVYHFEFNQTSILLPKFISNAFQLSTSVDLGVLYYFYMAAVSIFCPNSINILAGINGLEVGQTLVIAVLLVINDLYYIVGYFLEDHLIQSAFEVHMFSLCFLIPFLGISLALYKYNKFPAKVFVGDTWCYFSGMVFAVIGISGHFAKTLMLFFLPQILNFVYSSPQLFGIVPCPRHRLPKFNESDGLLYNSYTEYEDSEESAESSDGKKKQLKPYLKPVFNLLEKMYLIKLVRNEKGEIVKSSNLTLINLVIIWFGPRNEGKLCTLIMQLQFAVGLLMLILRHTLAPTIFGFDNSWSMLNRFYIS